MRGVVLSKLEQNPTSTIRTKNSVYFFYMGSLVRLDHGIN
jgi:hypothetical protein